VAKEPDNETLTVSAKEACRIAGVSYRQLDYWKRQNLFQIDTDAQGSGSRRRMSVMDIRCLLVVKELMAAGLTRNLDLVCIVVGQARNPDAQGVAIHAGRVYTLDQMAEMIRSGFAMISLIQFAPVTKLEQATRVELESSSRAALPESTLDRVLAATSAVAMDEIVEPLGHNGSDDRDSHTAALAVSGSH
jgi:hypothetical protein